MSRARAKLPRDALVSAIALLFCGAAGGACQRFTSESTKIPVPRVVMEGVVATPGVSIWAADSSFRFDAGTPFRTPFVSQRCVKVATAENYGLARQIGAEPVVVQVPGLPQPLYGLLALCRVPNFATGPATHSYRIEVPQSYVDATTGERVSTVYETTNWDDYPAWQLWLSRTPRIWQ